MKIHWLEVLEKEIATIEASLRIVKEVHAMLSSHDAAPVSEAAPVQIPIEETAAPVADAPTADARTDGGEAAAVESQGVDGAGNPVIPGHPAYRE